MPKRKNDQYIKLPVTVGYDPDKVIGHIRVNQAALPQQPNYVFAVGGIAHDSRVEWDESLGRQVNVITDFELTEITLLPEREYAWPGRKEANDQA